MPMWGCSSITGTSRMQRFLRGTSGSPGCLSRQGWSHKSICAMKTRISFTEVEPIVRLPKKSSRIPWSSQCGFLTQLLGSVGEYFCAFFLSFMVFFCKTKMTTGKPGVKFPYPNPTKMIRNPANIFGSIIVEMQNLPVLLYKAVRHQHHLRETYFIYVLDWRQADYPSP